MAGDLWTELREKLPAIKAEYERLGRLIAAIEGTDSAPIEREDEEATGATQRETRNNKPGVIGRDDFVRMSTGDAIKAFLAKMGRGNPQGPREMARALIQGGRGDTDEETAYANVASALKRLKKTGEVIQVRRGEWGLADWYAGKQRNDD